MRILQVASEIAPLAKVGGLGDVVAGLSSELASNDHDVTVVIPRYGVIDTSLLKHTGRIDTFDSYYAGERHRTQVEHYALPQGFTIALIDTVGGHWKLKPTIYGVAHEDVAHFIQFSRAVFDWMRAVDDLPYDVIHLHDWQASFLAALVELEEHIYPQFPAPRVILTLHNLDYQGHCSFSELEKGGYHRQRQEFHDIAVDPRYDCANILKIGIIFSDTVTTVSPTYAHEVLTTDKGRGLNEVLCNKGTNFLGILNGLDYDYWDPATDSFLPDHYHAASKMSIISSAKKQSRRMLFESLNIHTAHEAKPCIGVVARLVEQKGLPMIESVLERAEQLDVTFVLLGTAYDEHTYQRFERHNTFLRSIGRGGVVLHSSERIAHLIYASSDILLIPSIFEPCGLTQIIAMRYGTVPIVRKTGGLSDTVVDADHPVTTDYVQKSNGYVFLNPDVPGIDSALHRALHDIHHDPIKWEKLVKSDLVQDFSWKQSAQKYISVYSSCR